MPSDKTPLLHEIVVVPGNGPQDLLQQCFQLRIDVFVTEQGFPLDVEFDDMEEAATHLLLRLTPSLKPVGTIRGYRTKDGNSYKLSRLVVLADFRHYGFGGELVLALHKWIEEDAKSVGGSNPIRVLAHSQIPAKRFYARFGYCAEGDEFDEDGAPHQSVVAQLFPFSR